MAYIVLLKLIGCDEAQPLVSFVVSRARQAAHRLVGFRERSYGRTGTI